MDAEDGNWITELLVKAGEGFRITRFWVKGAEVLEWDIITTVLVIYQVG